MKRKNSTARVKAWQAKNKWSRPLEYAKRRCKDPKHREYERYGGRGIRCTLTSEQAKILFARDAGHLLERPSLDRIDSKGHYCLENCRFIEWHENISNKQRWQEAAATSNEPYEQPIGPPIWED